VLVPVVVQPTRYYSDLPVLFFRVERPGFSRRQLENSAKFVELLRRWEQTTSFSEKDVIEQILQSFATSSGFRSPRTGTLVVMLHSVERVHPTTELRTRLVEFPAPDESGSLPAYENVRLVLWPARGRPAAD
jgi:hypothetical protein